MIAPQNIRVHRDQGILELTWSDQHVSRLPFQFVRQNCRCAVCVDEMTGRPLLDPTTVPADLGVLDISVAGNYALRVRWSDNHDSGLFTWVHLRTISERLEAARRGQRTTADD